MKTVLLFGTFDNLHEGHRAMLSQAWDHGDRIVVALAPDDVVKRLKGKKPKQSFEERAEALDASGLVDDIVESDSEDGSYEVLSRVQPDIVAFGYDQHALQENFNAYLQKNKKKVPTVTLASFEPKRYKSSLM